MAEALISRSGGINAETLQKIEDLEFKDPSYATIICTLQDPDGSPISNEKIKITPLDSGSEVEYTTNEKGQVLYRTIASQVKLNDSSFPGYYDQTRAIDQIVDSAVGVVYRPNLIRSKSLQNGQNIVLSGSGSIKFSNLIERFNLNMSAGAGSHYGCQYSNIGFNMDASAVASAAGETYRWLSQWLTITANDKVWLGDNVGCGEGGAGYNIIFKPIGGQEYSYSIGTGGNGSYTKLNANRGTVNNGGLHTAALFGRNKLLWSDGFSTYEHGQGSAGSTTYFGSYSAIGGRGGYINTMYSDKGFSHGGNYWGSHPIGINGRYHLQWRYRDWADEVPMSIYQNFNEFTHFANTLFDRYWDSYRGLNFNATATMNFPKANDGWCVLENIQYK